jgi:hypothetical protein
MWPAATLRLGGGAHKPLVTGSRHANPAPGRNAESREGCNSPPKELMVNTDAARELFERFRGSIAFVEVESADGKRGIGSAFHVGEGVFVTARHVVEGKKILQVGTTEDVYIPLEGEEAGQPRAELQIGEDQIPVHWIAPQVLALRNDPRLSSDPLVDVAVFQVEDIDPRTPVMLLGSHLDDWLGRSDFVLSQVVVLGYPPIPLTREPTLIATRADVVAQIDRYDAPNVHFVVSSMARGGFSGGVAYSEYGFVLGVITQSLVSDGKPEELGYSTVTSIEPILTCLADCGMLPAVQTDGWDGLWHSRRLQFRAKGATDTEAFRSVAGIELFDDGLTVWLELSCSDRTLLSRLAAEASDALQLQPVVATTGDAVRIRNEGKIDAARRDQFFAVAREIAQELIDANLEPVGAEDPWAYFT